MSEIKLRDYQQQAVDKIKERYADGKVIFSVSGADASRSFILTEGMSTGAALRHHAAMNTVIVAGDGDYDAAKLQELADAIPGNHFKFVAINEAGHVVDPMTDAERDRALWNEAVDMRKAERRQRRAFYRVQLGVPYSEGGAL